MANGRRRTTSLLPPTNTPLNLNPSPLAHSHPITPSPSLPNLASRHPPNANVNPPMPDQQQQHPQASSFASNLTRDISPSQLQNHLYTAFLQQATPDVALRIRGSWRAIYNLHRVVLIQAGFFKSLFTAGFIESKPVLPSRRNGPHIVDVAFDDPNITRPAFEICIARLYGGGPPLHISPTLIPSPSHPLTNQYPFTSSPISLSPSSCPPTHHPSSPRFLLSLLATALYLSIPSVASQVLTLVLSTIGPHTVIPYLNFALGKGIGNSISHEPEAAVGLETIAQPIANEDEYTDSVNGSSNYGTVSSHSGSLDDSLELKDEKSADFPNDLDVKKEDPCDLSQHSNSSEKSTSRLPTYCYGGISDRIGEAVGCWLTRWGVDMLHLEEECQHDNSQASPASPTTRKRASTLPMQLGISAKLEAHGTEIEEEAPNVPLIWRRGGLDPNWARIVLSSDTLFVKGEKERYNMARSVVEMRRKVGVIQEEESEWTSLFDKGIYYTNMNLDELMSIMEDVSPTTGRPYVSLSVLQSAHWDQSVLHHHITFRPPGSPSSPSMSTRSTDLGITITTEEIVKSLTSPSKKTSVERSTKDSPHYPVPTDSSSRIGDSSGLEGATMDQLFDLGSPKKNPPSHPSHNTFGLEQFVFSGSVCSQEDPEKKLRWSTYPPLRFAVEFWDVDALKEKSRLHSHTVWYAGSLWNVYVQVVRKKGVQLGVYLHRQSSIDPIPPSSAPLPLSSGSGIPLRQSYTFHAEGSPVTSRSSTPHPRPWTSHSNPASPSVPSSFPNSYSSSSVHAPISNSGTTPATAPPVMPTQPYRDPRSSVSAYFTIACASATGASLTRFTSSPDNFSVSQSWGWKSSSLRTEEYLELSDDGLPKAASAAGKEISLRATIVLGVV